MYPQGVDHGEDDDAHNRLRKAASGTDLPRGLSRRMPRSYVTLAEYPMDMVRLACTKCDRRGQYRKATLLERYGSDQEHGRPAARLAADCPKIATGKIMDLCGVYYPDRIG